MFLQTQTQTPPAPWQEGLSYTTKYLLRKIVEDLSYGAIWKISFGISNFCAFLGEYASAKEMENQTLAEFWDSAYSDVEFYIHFMNIGTAKKSLLISQLVLK